MNIRCLTAAFSYAVCLLSVSCYLSTEAKRDNMTPGINHQESTPVLAIEVGQPFRLGEPIKFDWKISNPGSKPVYVLSTLLEPQNNGFTELSIDSKENILGIGFLRSIEAVGFPPYSFPKLQFKQIDPGSSWAGTFVSDAPIAELRDYKVIGTKLDETKITPGVWNVRAAIAYGYELESVERALKESLHAGQEHPINAVVRWQKVEYSVPLVIGIQK